MHIHTQPAIATERLLCSCHWRPQLSQMIAWLHNSAVQRLPQAADVRTAVEASAAALANPAAARSSYWPVGGSRGAASSAAASSMPPMAAGSPTELPAWLEAVGSRRAYERVLAALQELHALAFRRVRRASAEEQAGAAGAAGAATAEGDALGAASDGGLTGPLAAESTLATELHAASSEPPEYYNDDQAWGDAIARAVAAGEAVGRWPDALRRLCDAAHVAPSALMGAKQLVLGFLNMAPPVAQAVAEVLEVLLRTSSSLTTLTLHDGGETRAWTHDAPPEAWAGCAGAVACARAARSTRSTCASSG